MVCTPPPRTSTQTSHVSTSRHTRAASAHVSARGVRPTRLRRSAAPRTTPVFEEQLSGTAVLLQAVSVVDSNVVWVSGHASSWARTTDGGRSWNSGVVPGADTLEFLDVHAASAGSAWLLSAGPGDLSRIYRTDDGGGRWTLQWTNAEPADFYDCMDFWDDRRGGLQRGVGQWSCEQLGADDRRWPQLELRGRPGCGHSRVP